MNKPSNHKRKITLMWCHDYCDVKQYICNHIKNCIKKHIAISDPIKFAVDDTPSMKEWRDMSDAERMEAWDNATGVYGIRDTGRDFGGYGHLLVGTYYGSPQGIKATDCFSDYVENTTLMQNVGTLVDNMLDPEDINATGILLRFKA